mmetsp:Transcript_17577/g.26338  ORF Transcript_17577/g.26338 Transcript_17577/m.26338 type:complete len:649 (+) Transcript_17577:86-2032(+)
MEDFSWERQSNLRVQNESNRSKSQLTAMTEDTASTISRTPSNASLSGFGQPSSSNTQWKRNIQHSVNFDMVAPGIITLLGFDGIEMWGMESKTGNIIMLADVVRNESVLNWSRYSAVYKFQSGKGMVGRVYRTGNSEWKSNVSKAQTVVFNRNEGAEKLGIKGVGCIRCDTSMGVEVVIFLYSRRELTFSQDRIAFIEGMISKWISNGNKTQTFYSTNSNSAQKDGPRFSTDAKSKSSVSSMEISENQQDLGTQQELKTNNRQGTLMRLMVLDLFLSSFGGITKHLRFDGSEIWIEDNPGSGILHHGGTIATKPLHKEWASYSTRFKFANDRSMIGRILASTRPEWQPDVSHLSVSVFTRVNGARRYGVRGMGGVYCRTRQGLQFVIGLFSGNRVVFTKERKRAILKMVEIWAQGSIPGPQKPIKIISRTESVLPAPVPMETQNNQNNIFPTVSLNKWVDMQADKQKGAAIVRYMNGSPHSTNSAPTSNTRTTKRGKQRCRYVCNYCEKVFHKKGNWQAHLRTHTKEKPFACTACGRQFTQKSNMKRHMFKIHKIPKDYTPPPTALRHSNSMPALPEHKDMTLKSSFFVNEASGQLPPPLFMPSNPSIGSNGMNTLNSQGMNAMNQMMGSNPSGSSSTNGGFPWMRTS